MKLNEPFTQVPNSLLQGTTIRDPYAMILYCHFLSHSKRFTYNHTQVNKSLKISKEKYKDSLNILEKLGWIKREKRRDAYGQFKPDKILIYGRDYYTFPSVDLPCTDLRSVDLPCTDLPLHGNKDYNNINSNNTNSNNKKINNKKERESEIENKKLSLSNFEFLLLNYKDEVLKLETEFKTKLSDWNFCIEKFNEHPHVKNITAILLKSWLIKELEYENKNPELVQAIKEKPKRKIFIGGF